MAANFLVQASSPTSVVDSTVLIVWYVRLGLRHFPATLQTPSIPAIRYANLDPIEALRHE